VHNYAHIATVLRYAPYYTFTDLAKFLRISRSDHLSLYGLLQKLPDGDGDLILLLLGLMQIPGLQVGITARQRG
jgi:hypothetical protein